MLCYERSNSVSELKKLIHGSIANQDNARVIVIANQTEEKKRRKGNPKP